METRISKYAAFRSEILNSGLIAEKVLADSSITREYKVKIDKINPIILQNLKCNLSFGKLVSVNQKTIKEYENLNDVINKINEKEITNLTNTIENWSHKHKIKSVINEDNKIAASFLDEDENYQKISGNKQRLEILRNNWATFQVTSREQITKLDQLAKSQETLNTFKNLEITKKPTYPSSASYKGLGKIFLLTSFFLIVLAISLVIVKNVVMSN